MAAKIKLGPQHAHIPGALPFFLLRAGKPLPYPLWTRIGDRRAGRRDRAETTRAPGDEVPVADTPWLSRLTSECSTAIASERIRAEALVAIIDRERAELEARLSRANEISDASRAELDKLAAKPVDDGIVGTGERYSQPSERLQRRRLEQAAAIAAAEGRAASATAEMLEIRARLGILDQERRSHLTVLKERARNLTKHYQRRASTYVRALERRRGGITWRVPDIPCPDWAVAELGTGRPTS